MRRSSGDAGTEQTPTPSTVVSGYVVPSYVASGYLFIGLLALLAGLILGLAAVMPPSPAPAAAGGKRFSAEAALPLVLSLVEDAGPHPVGTDANAAVRAGLIAELEGLGLEVTTQEAFACREQWLVCGNVVNVMTRLPGESDGPAVLLTAHYDSVGAGPGVSDDLTGVVAILETARLLLNEEPLRNPFILLFTDGEEMGLLGAEAFATHPWLAEVGVVVNVEARGTRGQSALFETSDNNAWLIDAFARQAPRPVANSLLYELYRLLPNDTDFSVYKEAGKAGVNFAYFEEVAHYHTPHDDLAHLSRASFQHHGDNVLAAARAFGDLDLQAPPRGNSIYLDFIPGQIMRLPAALALPLAIALLLAWVVMIVVLMRRRMLDWIGVLLGVLASLLALALAGALGFGVVEAVAAVTGRDFFYYAEPVATRATIWLAALLSLLIAVVPLARRAGFWGLSAGIWLLWSLACLATAVAVPGASVFFLVPLVASVILYAITLFTPLWGSVWAPPITAAATALVTAYLWLPLVLSLESGLGLEMAPGIAACAALAFTAFAPLLAQPQGHGQGRSMLVLATVTAMIVTGALAATSQNFTEERPQRLSLLHLQTATDGEPQGAKWLVDAYPPPVLDDELSEVARFVEDNTVRLPWTGARFLSAEGPLLENAAPGLSVVSEEAADDGRILTVRLITPRDAPRLSLVVPAGSGLQSISVPGTPYVMEVGQDDDRTVFTCHGAGCSGIVLELHFAAIARADPAAAADTTADAAAAVTTADATEAASLTFTVADMTYGLPEEGLPLLEARLENAVPSQDGDVSVMLNHVTVPGPAAGEAE